MTLPVPLPMAWTISSGVSYKGVTGGGFSGRRNFKPCDSSETSILISHVDQIWAALFDSL
jgi:hypothetical protein